MEIFLDFLVSAAKKAIVFLPISFVARFAIEKLFGFEATFKSTYFALFVGNLAASTVIPILYWFGWLEPHGNDPGMVLGQLIVLYAVHFSVQTLSLYQICRDGKGGRLPLSHAALVVLALTALSMATTAFYWIVAQ